LSAAGDVPPKFTQLLKDIEGTEGELVRFECRVIGQPTPTIKWFRGRNQIDNSPDFQVTHFTKRLFLHYPRKSEQGKYYELIHFYSVQCNYLIRITHI